MTKLTGLFPAINLVPAGIVVKIMFLPRLLILVLMFPLRMGVVTTLLFFKGWLRTERGTVILVGSLPVCVVTTVALTGTCLTVAAAVPSERVDPEPAVPSVTPLAPATPLVAMVTVAAPDDTVIGFVLVVVVAIETAWPCF